MQKGGKKILNPYEVYELRGAKEDEEMFCGECGVEIYEGEWCEECRNEF